MTWTELCKHANERLDDYALAMLRGEIPQRLALFHQGSAAAADGLEFWYTRILLVRGPAFLRGEFDSIKHILPQSVEDYVNSCAGEKVVSTALLGYANATNLFETIGFDVPSAVLQSFRSVILRVETRHDDMPNRHWAKGLASLVLGERWGWAPIAGFAPLQDVPFVPRAKFEFNVQALIAHLGGAILAEAPLSEVLPAWHQFMALAVTLMDVRLIDESVILWVARIVFHHIGQEPLSSVGEHVFEEINQLIAAGR